MSRVQSKKDDEGVPAGGLCDFIVVIGSVFKEEIFRFPCLENPYGEVEGFFGVECGDVVDVNDLRFLFVKRQREWRNISPDRRIQVFLPPSSRIRRVLSPAARGRTG